MKAADTILSAKGSPAQSALGQRSSLSHPSRRLFPPCKRTSLPEPPSDTRGLACECYQHPSQMSEAMPRHLLLPGDTSPPSVLLASQGPTSPAYPWGGLAAGGFWPQVGKVPAAAADLQPQQEHSAGGPDRQGTVGPKPRACTKGKGKRTDPGACLLTQPDVSGGLLLARVRTRDVARDLKLLPLAADPSEHR